MFASDVYENYNSFQLPHGFNGYLDNLSPNGEILRPDGTKSVTLYLHKQAAPRPPGSGLPPLHVPDLMFELILLNSTSKNIYIIFIYLFNVYIYFKA